MCGVTTDSVVKEPRVCVAPPGDDRDRTGDLLLAKQALSQLSYVPEAFGLRRQPL